MSGGLAALDVEGGWYTFIPYPQLPTVADSVVDRITWRSDSEFTAEISTSCHYEAVAEGLCDERKLAPYTMNVDLRDPTLVRSYSLPSAVMLEAQLLQAMPSPDRIRTVFAKQGNMAVQIARATLSSPSSALPTAAVVRVASAGRDQAEADWPLRLTLSDTGGAVAEPGWYVVSGDLRPDRDAATGGGLPSATVAVSNASRCESEGCASANDLMAMLYAAYRLNQSQGRGVR